VKRNRFITRTGAKKGINGELEAKVRGSAGLKGYVTNGADPTPEFVIGAYHQLSRIEKSFRMSKHDLRARPIYHHKRESIEAHLTIVFAALAVTPGPAHRGPHRLVKQFVRTARATAPSTSTPASTPHRRRPTSSGPTRRTPADHLTREVALVWSGVLSRAWVSRRRECSPAAARASSLRFSW
jgi:hypothetical protein